MSACMHGNKMLQISGRLATLWTLVEGGREMGEGRKESRGWWRKVNGREGEGVDEC